MRTGEIGAVQPFRYTLLVWAMIFGIVMFGEWPDAWMLAGSAIVVGAGLFTLYRERRVAGADRWTRRAAPYPQDNGRGAQWRARPGSRLASSRGSAMKVACIGECMVELTLPREKGGETRVGFAGDTFNAAVYLKRSAPARSAVAYVTAVGTDALSDGMVAAFAAEGSTPSLVERRADRAPGLYAISVDAKGERSFTYWRESSAARTLFLPPAHVTPDRLAGFDLVYLSGITVAILTSEGRAALLDFLPGYRAGGRAGRVRFELPAAALARRRRRHGASSRPSGG